MTQIKQGNIQVGEAAPDFTLNDQNGKPVRFTGLLGKTAIVLYFYPKDNTAGCTAEACAFRDSYEAFNDAGATVVGVSADSAESHQAFASRHSLPFILLSDPDSVVHKLYGVGKKLGFITSRETFVIDRQGIVRQHFVSQLNATKHVTEALQTLKSMQTTQA
ncbi:MAG TPA: peroxiredoxin [Anaerolineae bacterium]